MIIKTRTNDRGEGNPCWNYHDEVTSASVYYNTDIASTCIDISFRDGSHICLAVSDIAYLLNDNGKTIERILPEERLPAINHN